MELHRTKANPNSPISGYDFVRAVLNQPGIDGVGTLLAAAHGGETDWLEKKASVYPSVEHDPMFRAKLEKCPPDKVAEETRFYEAEILRTIASAVVALYNSRGGAVLIGIDDSNNPVPFETCDPNGILKRHGLEAYVREAIVERVFPDNGEFQCKKEVWSIPAKSIGVVPKLVPYRGNSILALLVPSPRHGVAPVLVTKIENNRSRTILLQREVGDIGAVRKETVEVNWSNNVAALADFHEERERQFLSNADLSGVLCKLGIDPPKPELGPDGKQKSFRHLFRLTAIIALLATFSIVILVVKTTKRPSRENGPKNSTSTSDKPDDGLSETDRSAIESFLLAHFAMMQGGDFLSFYNVLPSTWRQALDESIPALVEKCPDVEFALFMDAAQTFYRSWALHATWKAEANNNSNLQNGYTKTEIRDMVLRYSASAQAIVEAATTNSLLKGNLSTLLSLPPAELPAGIKKPAPYNVRKPAFRFESKADGSVIVTPTPYLNQPLRMVKIDGTWVSEYWAGCFKDCESWRKKIDAIQMTPVRRLWLMKNLIVLQGLTRIGEGAATSNVGLWADYWANYAVKMCMHTVLDDSFKPADWARIYYFYRQYAPYPKLLITYDATEMINLLDDDPAFMNAPMGFHPDAESERKAAEEAERERLRRLAASTNGPPVVRDAQKDFEWIGRSLLLNDNAYPTNSIFEK